MASKVSTFQMMINSEIKRELEVYVYQEKGEGTYEI